MSRHSMTERLGPYQAIVYGSDGTRHRHPLYTCSRCEHYDGNYGCGFTGYATDPKQFCASWEGRLVHRGKSEG